MKKRNHYFKRVYWLFACGFILIGCSNHHSTEVKNERTGNGGSYRGICRKYDSKRK